MGDPQPGRSGAGGLQLTLTYPDGARVPLEIAPALRNAAAGLSGRRVVIRGETTGDAGARRIVARTMQAAEGEEPRER